MGVIKKISRKNLEEKSRQYGSGRIENNMKLIVIKLKGGEYVLCHIVTNGKKKFFYSNDAIDLLRGNIEIFKKLSKICNRSTEYSNFMIFNNERDAYRFIELFESELIAVKMTE